ncbi:hypothetical protein H2200_011211 [Cladophialophora chaetospira]|uniref:Ion channel n=1 Tax=Cladophialophora chaetospira TaxID=386627 RepID=A0AA38X071_9EURO|nr:hypothetical protein H2200_011211 [Cladophialophora chaetospira]
MPQLDETRQSLLHAEEETEVRVRRFWDGFTDFALRDNILEIAVGLITAAAFTRVVNSLTSDLLLPIISLLPFLRRNFDEKFAVLRRGPHYTKGHGYNTLKQALDDGAVVMAYGYVNLTSTFLREEERANGRGSSFLNNVINFFALGFSLYAIALIYSSVSHDSIIKKTVKCKYCRKSISPKAKRCVNCTSWQDGREDK